MAVHTFPIPRGLLATANTWTAAQRFNDSVLLTFGSVDGTDADIFYDGTNLEIDVNSGDLDITIAGGDVNFQQATTIVTTAGDLILTPAGVITLGNVGADDHLKALLAATLQFTRVSTNLGAQAIQLFSSASGTQDANARFQLRSDGYMAWGPGGGTAVDTVLYRSGVNILHSDDSLTLSGTLGLTATRVSNIYTTDQTTTNAETVDSWSRSKENILEYHGDALSVLRKTEVISFSHLLNRDPSGRIKLGVRAESIGEPMALVERDYGHGLGEGPALDTMGLTALNTKAIQQIDGWVSSAEYRFEAVEEANKILRDQLQIAGVLPEA